MFHNFPSVHESSERSVRSEEHPAVTRLFGSADVGIAMMPACFKHVQLVYRRSLWRSSLILVLVLVVVSRFLFCFLNPESCHEPGCKNKKYREDKYSFNPALIHDKLQCQRTLHFPFRVGCPADCTPYTGYSEGRLVTMQWYFGQPDKYNPDIAFEKQETYSIRGRNFQCPQEFVSTFQKASRDAVTRGNSTISSLDLKFYLEEQMHLSLLYLCCLTKEQSEQAQGILHEMIDQWTESVTVRFDRLQCWHKTHSSVTNIITVDDESQCKLFQILQKVTKRLQEKGIPIWIPRNDQMPFHVTLIGLRLGKNVESCLPKYNISGEIPSIYTIMQQISKDYNGKWNNEKNGMVINHPPQLSWNAGVHTKPVKDCVEARQMSGILK